MKSGRAQFAWVWTGLIVAACLVPGGWLPEESSTAPGQIPHLDKFVHFGMFAAFAVLWRRAGPGTGWGWRVLACGLCLAVATELAQAAPFIKRDSDPWDALADAAGVIAGLAAFRGSRSTRPLINPESRELTTEKCGPTMNN